MYCTRWGSHTSWYKLQWSFSKVGKIKRLSVENQQCLDCHSLTVVKIKMCIQRLSSCSVFMFCTCLHALVGLNLWYGQHVVCFLYIYRYNNSPAAEQHIQQSVLDLPVRHQCIRCWFPLGVHRYEERWLVGLQITLSGLFPCVDLLSASSYYRVIKKIRGDCWSGWLSWAQKEREWGT